MKDQPEKKQGLSIRHRRSTHWELSGSTYFITWRLHQKQHDLQDTEKDIVATAIKHFHKKRYELFAFVVMNDHVHVIACLNSGETLSKLLHSWKSFTANQLQRLHQRQGAIWQEEYFDRIIRTPEDLTEKIEYVMNNPIKRWPGTKNYEWVGVANE